MQAVLTTLFQVGFSRLVELLGGTLRDFEWALGSSLGEWEVCVDGWEVCVDRVERKSSGYLSSVGARVSEVAWSSRDDGACDKELRSTAARIWRFSGQAIS